MTRKAIILFLLLSSMTISAYAQQTEVDVTYVGNAGFLIKVGDKKILIDALFKGFEGSYIVPQNVQDKLTLAQAPFDDVDLVVVTHAHGDHVDPDMVRQHLSNNPKAIFASTQQLVDALHDSTDRCVGFKPTKEKSESKLINDISIEAFYFPHGSNTRIINIGFLISVNGVTLFQTGDFDNKQYTFDEFRALQLPDRKIDLAFIQHYYLTDDADARKFVVDGIGGKYIIPIHYHFTTPAFDSLLIKQNYPDAILFKEEMQSWKMPDKIDEFSGLKDIYFNQPLPGDSAVIFAPGIVSVNGRYEYGVSFSPDLKEIYFTAHRKGESSSVYFSKLLDKKWTNPQKANLTEGQKREEMEAFVSPGGNKIYFTAYDSRDVKIWQASRSGSWWADPIKLDSPINDDIVFYSNAAKNGDLFYKNVSKGKMYYAPNKNGTFPEIFEAGIEYGSHGFIAPSQDFMLIDARKENDKTKDKDIHVCFKKTDGTWTKPINLGNTVNSNFNEICPSITPDGNYLFFSRYNEEGGIPNIYWVDANIIKKLKEKAMQESSPQNYTNLKGDYLGQPLPGNTPKIFAPGIISGKGRLHCFPTFSNDNKEIYWMVVPPQIITMKETGHGWSAADTAAFAKGTVNQAPFVSHDDRIYFSSPRTGGKGAYDIWYVMKTDSGYSTPINIEGEINSDKSESQPSVSNNNTMFYTGSFKGKLYNRGIYCSRFENGKYQPPAALPEPINIINENNLDYTPFIASDESYLLFCSNRQNPEKELCHIYISYKNKKGEWGKPIDLSLKMKFFESSKFPYITADNKFLFFSSGANIYWVDAEIIHVKH